MNDGCAWCGSAVAAERGGRLECRDCGAATTSPWPSDEELAAAYGDWYRPGSGRFGPVGDALLRRSRAALARRIDSVVPRGLVVDVGAGDGALVRAVAATGRDALGLERSVDSADADSGLIQEGDLEGLSSPCAACIFWHSLEHLREPRAAVRRAAHLLVPGGRLFVAVPNYASLQARVFGDRWFALDLPRHLVHLPAPALIEGLRADGFVVERVSYWRGGQVVFGWLHGLVGLFGLDLYQAIRSPVAHSHPIGLGRRFAALAAALLFAPAAACAAAAEIALRRGGTVYVEARVD